MARRKTVRCRSRTADSRAHDRLAKQLENRDEIVRNPASLPVEQCEGAGDRGCAGPCGCTSPSQSAPVRRRDFVWSAAAALASMALVACGASGELLTSPATVPSTGIRLADFPTLLVVG